MLHKKTHGLVDNIVKALQASAAYAVLNGDERIKKEHITNVDVLLDMFGMSMSSYD